MIIVATNHTYMKSRKEKLTVTRFKPDKLAPRQRPVDIAPQPEYKSNKATSDFLRPLLSQTSSHSNFTPAASISLDIVDELSGAVVLFSTS
jgi:hypothetical protein